MSPILILTGLLAVAYFGSMLVGGRAVRGYGLPSGTEFLLLGIFLGPHFLGVIGAATLSGFEGITVFALAWLTLVAGAHWGNRRGRRVPRARMLLGIGLTGMTALATGLAAATAAALLTSIERRDLPLLAVGVAAVSSETTRHAVGWVVERYDADGPLAVLIEEVAEADDGVPVLLVALFSAMAPRQLGIAISWPVWGALLATAGIGGAMGATCAALIDIEPRTSQRWGILLGTALLAVGASLRLGLGAVAATFLMGFTATSLARQRAVLQAMIRSSERAVMLPALVLGGAYATAPSLGTLVPIALAVLGARVLAKQLTARRLIDIADKEASTSRKGSASARTLGLGLMSAGALSVTAGFACALRAPGLVGELVLALAVGSAILGELIGPYSLHRALGAAGELPERHAPPSAGRAA